MFRSLGTKIDYDDYENIYGHRPPSPGGQRIRRGQNARGHNIRSPNPRGQNPRGEHFGGFGHSNNSTRPLSTNYNAGSKTNVTTVPSSSRAQHHANQRRSNHPNDMHRPMVLGDNRGYERNPQQQSNRLNNNWRSSNRDDSSDGRPFYNNNREPSQNSRSPGLGFKNLQEFSKMISVPSSSRAQHHANQRRSNHLNDMHRPMELGDNKGYERNPPQQSDRHNNNWRSSNRDGSSDGRPFHNNNREPFQNSRPPGLGFKNLQEFSEMDPDKLLTTLNLESNNLKSFLSDDIKEDMIILFVKCLKNLSTVQFDIAKSNLLIIITKSKFLNALQKYVMGLPFVKITDKRMNSLFWNDIEDFYHNVIKYIEAVIDLSPRTAVNSFKVLLASIHVSLQGLEKHQKETISDGLLDAFENIQVKFSICSEEEGKKAFLPSKSFSGVGYARDVLPPDNFRDISIMPLKEDLTDRPNFLRPNIVDGAYTSVEHYLDVQFRLMREDFIAPLRDALREYKMALETGKKLKFGGARFYSNAKLLSFKLKNGVLAVEICYNQKLTNKKRGERKANSKRFMYGSLICLTCDDFENIIFCTVHDRDDVEVGKVSVEVAGDPITEKMFSQSYLLIECETYFPPYLHVLKALQNPTLVTNFPFEKYIVKVEPAEARPAYLQDVTEYTLFDGTRVNLQDPNLRLPWTEDIGLDRSQYTAYTMALLREFVTIQGPPGTGKTYIGLKIASTILNNFYLKQPQVKHFNPILVVCYTNHALDQFLEGLLKVTKKMVRIGGQSKNEVLKEFNLNNLRKFTRDNGKLKNNLKDYLRHIETFQVLFKSLKSKDHIFDLANETIVFRFPHGVTIVRKLAMPFNLKDYLSKFADGKRPALVNWLLLSDLRKANKYRPNLLTNVTKPSGYSAQRSDNNEDDEFKDFLIDDDDKDDDYANRSVVDVDFADGYEIKTDAFEYSVENATNTYKSIDPIKRQLREESYRDLEFLKAQLLRGNDKYRKILLETKDEIMAEEFNPEQRWSLYWGWIEGVVVDLSEQFKQAIETYLNERINFDEVTQALDLDTLKNTSVVRVTTSGTTRLQSLLRSLCSLRSSTVIVEEAAEVMESHVFTKDNGKLKNNLKDFSRHFETFQALLKSLKAKDRIFDLANETIVFRFPHGVTIVRKLAMPFNLKDYLSKFADGKRPALVNWLLLSDLRKANKYRPNLLINVFKDFLIDDDDKDDDYANRSVVDIDFADGYEIKTDAFEYSVENATNTYKSIDPIKRQLREESYRDLEFLKVQLLRGNDKYRKILLETKDEIMAEEFNPEQRWSLYWGWIEGVVVDLSEQFKQAIETYLNERINFDEVIQALDLDTLKNTRVVGVSTSGTTRLQSLLRSLRSSTVIVEEAAEVMESHVVTKDNGKLKNNLKDFSRHVETFQALLKSLKAKDHIFDLANETIVFRFLHGVTIVRKLAMPFNLKDYLSKFADGKRPALVNWLLLSDLRKANKYRPNLLINVTKPSGSSAQRSDNNEDDEFKEFLIDDDDDEDDYLNRSVVDEDFADGYDIKTDAFEYSVEDATNTYKAIDPIKRQLREESYRDLEFLKAQLLRGNDKYRKILLETKDDAMPEEFNPEQRWSLYWGWIEGVVVDLSEQFKQAIETYRREKVNFDEVTQALDVDTLKNTHVVGVTTSGAARLQSLLRSLRSPIVIVEEAAEVMESHVVVSLTKDCQHLIMIGDHQQLRPITATYQMGKKYNLDISLFERMVKNGTHCHQLEVQHRMRPEIARLITPAIYKNLKNNANVEKYPDIKGVVKSLFFINHTVPESKVEDISSHLNDHEARFILNLAKYFIQQGYGSDEITILATYSGQMFHFRKLRNNMSMLKNVQINVLDNFQGEENKIILLSLVRSNSEENIGFLSTDNRVCVALSRAREGFFIIGNMGVLTKKSPLWNTINDTLTEQNSIGPSLILSCDIHKDVFTPMQKAEDFDKVPEGGCTKICGSLMGCGHNCKSFCHPLDRQHENVNCKEKCQRLLCLLEHACPLLCYEKCQPCRQIVRKVLPCKHEADVECHADMRLHKCQVILKVTLPLCHHETQKRCFQNDEDVKCPVKCEDRLACGHACRLLCHKKNDPDHMKYKCNMPCARLNKDCTSDHSCKLLCGLDCSLCAIPVKKVKKCSHTLTVNCCVDVNTVECPYKCKRSL